MSEHNAIATSPPTSLSERLRASTWQARVAIVVLPILAAAIFGLIASPGVTSARGAGATAGGGSGGLAPLSTVAIPQPSNLGEFVRDRGAVVALGKALFWDMQAGSDGQTACASCHFNGGADPRSNNQLNPRVGGFAVHGPNTQLSAADFPFHKLSDINNNGSAVMFDTNNVVGSQGVLPSKFVGVLEGNDAENVLDSPSDAIFQIGGVNVRRATGRNAPSVINAVFNHRNFWDGRAQDVFNGVNPFGARDTGAKVARANGSGADLVQVRLANSSLASQADGPPGNNVEMSADGRTLSDIGRKLLARRPLARQAVSTGDSVLGRYASASKTGLDVAYADLIKQGFQPQWWNSSAAITDPSTKRAYSMMQYNFSLYWGLAIQAYESTLVSDQTPVDRFLAGDSSALTGQEQSGLGIFRGKGNCTKCHMGPELTAASVSNVTGSGVLDNTNGTDTGFANLGVRPTASDPGNGGLDPFNNPLSESRLRGAANTSGVEGSFKIPSLRNVSLTAPYFHTGGEATLRQVVDFYSRGGDFANSQLHGDLKPIGLSEGEKTDLVAFLGALTDARVANQSAPFDHPQLFVPNGAQMNSFGKVLTSFSSHRAVDCFQPVPATGAAGGTPVPGFLEPSGLCVNFPQDTLSSAAGLSRIGNLHIAARITMRTLARRGLALQVALPDGTKVVRLTLCSSTRRGLRSVCLRTFVRATSGPTVRITWHLQARQLRALHAGAWALEVKAGPSKAHMLPPRIMRQLRIV